MLGESQRQHSKTAYRGQPPATSVVGSGRLHLGDTGFPLSAAMGRQRVSNPAYTAPYSSAPSLWAVHLASCLKDKYKSQAEKDGLVGGPISPRPKPY